MVGLLCSSYLCTLIFFFRAVSICRLVYICRLAYVCSGMKQLPKQRCTMTDASGAR
jgi:hypothetical protein